MTDLDPEARRILDLTREARTPSVQDKARIERLLGASVGFTAATAAISSTVRASQAPMAGAAGSSLLLQWTAVAGVVALLGAGSYWYARTTPQVATLQVAVPRAAMPQSVAQAKVIAAPAPDVSAPAPVVREQPSMAAPAPTPRAASTVRAGERNATLKPELDLLHEVQLKWRSGDAATALSLLAQHRERYPRSQLAPEREALRVLCLCAVGRTAEARGIARRFLASAPQSPLRSSVEESCAGSQSSAGKATDSGGRTQRTRLAR